MLKTTLKFLLAFALCFWLFKNGKLDFSLIPRVLSEGHLWILGIIFLFSRLFISSYRCQILLASKAQENISFFKVLCFNATGSFFSVILPGSSAGDIVKFFYFKNLSSKLSASTVASIIALDRFIGIFGLLFIGAFVCAIEWNNIQNLNPQLTTFIYINAVLCAALGVFIAIFFSNLFPKEKVLAKLSNYLLRWPKVLAIFSDLLSIKLGFRPFFHCFLLSVLNQLMIFFAFWALTSSFVPEHVSFLNLFTILPIGMIGAALPITPAGLGVGHVLFDNLFKLLRIDNGASLFNLVFVAINLVNLLGVIPYIFMKANFTKTQGN